MCFPLPECIFDLSKKTEFIFDLAIILSLQHGAMESVAHLVMVDAQDFEVKKREGRTL